MIPEVLCSISNPRNLCKQSSLCVEFEAISREHLRIRGNGMANTWDIANLSKMIGDGLFYPDVDDGDQSLAVNVWVTTKQFQKYELMVAYHYLAKNSIANAFMQGSISEIELRDRIKEGSTPEGLEKIAAHLVIRSVNSVADFKAASMLKAEKVDTGDGQRTPTIEIKH